jgi:hypothetical protein
MVPLARQTDIDLYSTNYTKAPLARAARKMRKPTNE